MGRVGGGRVVGMCVGSSGGTAAGQLLVGEAVGEKWESLVFEWSVGRRVSVRILHVVSGATGGRQESARGQLGDRWASVICTWSAARQVGVRNLHEVG